MARRRFAPGTVPVVLWYVLLVLAITVVSFALAAEFG